MLYNREWAKQQTQRPKGPDQKRVSLSTLVSRMKQFLSCRLLNNISLFFSNENSYDSLFSLLNTFFAFKGHLAALLGSDQPFNFKAK